MVKINDLLALVPLRVKSFAEFSNKIFAKDLTRRITSAKGFMYDVNTYPDTTRNNDDIFGWGLENRFRC